jgi:hypothetical protein
MLNRDRRLIRLIAAIVAAAGLSMMPAKAARQQLVADPCTEPRPAGFVLRDDSFWNGPWAREAVGAASKPLAALDNTNGQPTNGPAPIRLDDGSEGTLRVESRPCTPSDDCAPYDCGCTVDRDSYWIDVADAHGRAVAHMHLWAAYGKFQIVPVDLIDGVGDELLIVRVPAHSSPPIGYDLKIWKIGATTPVEIGGSERLANTFNSLPFGCARWRDVMSIDRTAAKPRPITLQTEFGAPACCHVYAEDAAEVADLRRDHVLRFDAASGKYVAR